MGQTVASGYKQGTITTQNLAPNSGAATALSAVEILLTDEMDTAAIQVTGTYTGALSIQASIDGVNFVTLGGNQALTNVATATQIANIASAVVGIFQVDVSAFQRLRVTALGAQTGTATVTVAASKTNGMVGIDTAIALAAGAAAIGSITNTAFTATPVIATNFALTAAATTNATSIKATAGSLFNLNITNYSSLAKFVKLYDKATAPVVGTDIPVDTIEVAANSFRQMTFGEIGSRFAAGIAYAITALQADTDTTATAAGDVKVHGSYI